MAVDVKVLYYDLRAVSDLTAAVSTDRFTGPLKEQKSKFLHHGAYVTQTVSCLITGKEVCFLTPALLHARFLLLRVFDCTR